jgi:uncharacterized protein (TIGR03086 family)
MTTIADRYRRLAQQFADRIALVPDDAWSNPSPCEGWTALDVVRHVVETQDMFLKLVGRELGEVPPVEADPGASWDAARAVVQADLDDPARAEVTFEGYFGTSTFAEAVDRFVSFDLIIHGWDLARATGQDVRIAPEDIEHVLERAKQFGATLRTSGVCGPEIEVAADADDQDRMLAFLGRQP